MRLEGMTSDEYVEISTRVSSRKKGVSAYAKNPFWRPTEVQVGKKRVTIAGGLVANPGTGESIEHAGIHRVEYVDEEKFVKLFTQNLKVFFDLTPASQKVLQCVLAALQGSINADGIHLPWFVVEEHSKKNELKISRASFHRALKEMLDKGFIAESEHPNFYWINPHLFFNGDRMTFISEYRKRDADRNEAMLTAKKKRAKNTEKTEAELLEEMGQQRLEV